MPDKKYKAIKSHFRTRSLERVGYVLSEGQQRDMIADIRYGRAEFVDRSSHRVTRWRFVIDHTPYIVIYDKSRKLLVTLWKDEPGSQMDLDDVLALERTQ